MMQAIRFGLISVVGAAFAGVGCAPTQHAPHSAAIATPAAEAQPADPAIDDTAYLTQLGLIRGHLLVGVALYREGARDHAATHMKHPEDELYAALAPAFAARGVPGFDDALGALADAVESGAPVSAVTAAHERVITDIAAAEQGGLTLETTAALELNVAQALVAEAAEEYAIGVVDGVVVNVHEYQDAYGFTRIAVQMLSRVPAHPTAGPQARIDAQRALAGLSRLDGLWPSLVAEGEIGTSAQPLFDVAAAMAGLDDAR